jgi:translocation and assembly module TamB
VLPAVSSTSPFRLAIDRRKPIQGRYYADGEIRPLWDLLMDSDRTLSGHVSAEGRIGGSLADPEPQGQATLANGRFEDWATGLVLQDLRLAARFAGNMIDVTDAVRAHGQGRDGNRGGRQSLSRLRADLVLGRN